MRCKLLNNNKTLCAFVYLALIVVTPSAIADKQVDVVIETKFGNIEIRLLPNIAPNHVKNFIKLAKSGYYDGTIFHRVIPGFMIQTGDPITKGKNKAAYGSGGPGYMISAEFNNQPHVRGAVSMARSQHPDSAGSQFFIVVKKSRFLDRKYTLFGRVVSGMDVADKIVAQKRDNRDNPLERIEIKVHVVNDSVLQKAPGNK